MFFCKTLETPLRLRYLWYAKNEAGDVCLRYLGADVANLRLQSDAHDLEWLPINLCNTTTFRIEEIHVKVKNKPIWARELLNLRPAAGAISYVPQFHSLERGPVATYTLYDVLVVAKPSLILTPSGEILYESSAYRDFPEPLGGQIHGTTVDTDKARLYADSQYCLLCGIWDYQFWHWMMDYIPKAVIAEAAGFTGKYLVPRISGFVEESLDMLGISQARLVEYDGTLARISSLLVVEAIEGFKDLPYYPALVHELRNRLLASSTRKPGGNAPERLYVARKIPERPRKVTNEVELMKLLKRFGFHKVYMEELPLREQIGLASSARAMVGPHGAGMVHALFMPERSLVIEFFSPYYVLTSQVSTLALFGHRYYSIVGSNGPLWPYKAGMDVEVDITLSEATLSRELREESFK